MLLLDKIESQYANAVITQCSEQKCSLNLSGLSNYVILKGEKISQNAKVCDCILFKINDALIIGLVELKSKTVHATEIIEN